MQARWGILQVLLSAGDELLKLQISEDNVVIELHENQIKKLGVTKIGEFLHKLQIYKSTADIKAASKLYEEVTSVPAKYLKLREIVLSKKKPRRLFLQAHSRIVKTAEGEDVVIQEFPLTFEGIIQYFVTQFPPVV